ncbi:hypothetical protein THIX_100017 [Thiomonas sp. X19]|nr:hypothetical protein THIX_100017 [Thiomonas sp. X19]
MSQTGGFDSSSNAKPDGSHLGNLQRIHWERWIERDALNPRGPFLNVSQGNAGPPQISLTPTGAGRRADPGGAQKRS